MAVLDLGDAPAAGAFGKTTRADGKEGAKDTSLALNWGTLLPGEFVSPVIAIRPVHGKGRGVVAQQAIPPGTLVLRTFGMGFSSEHGPLQHFKFIVHALKGEFGLDCAGYAREMLSRMRSLCPDRPSPEAIQKFSGTAGPLAELLASSAPLPPVPDPMHTRKAEASTGGATAALEAPRGEASDWASLLPTLLAKLDRNAFAQGVFPLACFLNHSCRQNCALGFPRGGAGLGAAAPGTGPARDALMGRFRVCEVRTCRPVRAGEELGFSYLSARRLHLPTPLRRAVLEPLWGFRCGCVRCAAVSDGRASDGAPPDGAPPSAAGEATPPAKSDADRAAMARAERDLLAVRCLAQNGAKRSGCAGFHTAGDGRGAATLDPCDACGHAPSDAATARVAATADLLEGLLEASQTRGPRRGRAMTPDGRVCEVEYRPVDGDGAHARPAAGKGSSPAASRVEAAVAAAVAAAEAAAAAAAEGPAGPGTRPDERSTALLLAAHEAARDVLHPRHHIMWELHQRLAESTKRLAMANRRPDARVQWRRWIRLHEHHALRAVDGATAWCPPNTAFLADLHDQAADALRAAAAARVGDADVAPSAKAAVADRSMGADRSTGAAGRRPEPAEDEKARKRAIWKEKIAARKRARALADGGKSRREREAWKQRVRTKGAAPGAAAQAPVAPLADPTVFHDSAALAAALDGASMLDRLSRAAFHDRAACAIRTLMQCMHD
jgi:hypothetical protein